MEYIERLAMGQRAAYSGLESAIHLARYALVKRLCAGRTVLDVACGEGYGSYLMATQWGASRVLGVDVSEEAIVSARATFHAPNLEFLQADVAELVQVLGGRQFDLAVSLETIEHVPDPEQFLRQLSEALELGGLIVISCPNDHLYYPDEDQRNPFHLRKYTRDEFVDMCSGVLGTPRATAMGVAVSGFANLRTEGELAQIGVGVSASDIIGAVDAGDLLLLPAQKLVGPSSSSSYFVAVWGGDDQQPPFTTSASVFPVGIDVLEAERRAVDEYVAWAQRALEEGQEELKDLRASLETLTDERDEMAILGRARTAELEVAKENLVVLRADRDRLHGALDALAYNPTRKQAVKAVFMSVGIRRSRLKGLLDGGARAGRSAH